MRWHNLFFYFIRLVVVPKTVQMLFLRLPDTLHKSKKSPADQ